jgi:ATP-dependent protease Clp ATPase subunit
MRFKMKKILSIILACFVAGCSPMPENEAANLPNTLNELIRPVTILACNENGVILQDGEGRVVGYASYYHFTKIMALEGYQKGDIFLDKEE